VHDDPNFFDAHSFCTIPVVSTLRIQVDGILQHEGAKCQKPGFIREVVAAIYAISRVSPEGEEVVNLVLANVCSSNGRPPELAESDEIVGDTR
jgi:hypothetical protein